MIQDRFGRKLKSLRLSVTDRCNLRCRYCMPDAGVPWLERDDILSIDEAVRLCRILVDQGVRRIKLTGGEPLLRPGIVDLVAKLSKIPRLEDLSMITNGLMLDEFAQDLKKAGLKRLTVSVDSLKSETFASITRGGDLAQVFRGLEAARMTGLAPLKVNCVMIQQNQDELERIAELAIDQPWEVRFIEYMPVTHGVDDPMRPTLTPDDLKARLEKRWGPFKSDDRDPCSPSRSYRVPGALGRIGFISSVSQPFCSSCDRLRLAANGFLKLCMAHPDGVDLLQPLRAGESDAQIGKRAAEAAWNKPEGHEFYNEPPAQSQLMSRMGG